MWGDAEGAYYLKQSDSLSASLFQITGPAHIPYNDSRWQQLLLHYEQLVHLHNLGLTPPSSVAEGDVVGSICRQCAKYSKDSSNLAAFCLHVARMIRDLQSSLEAYCSESKGSNAAGENDASSPKRQTNGSNGSPGKSAVKQRISLIGKARVTCGALNLLRILSHETIVRAFSISEALVDGEDQRGATVLENSHQSPLEYDTNYILNETFTYRSRGEVDMQNSGQDASLEIIAAIMAFLSSFGCIIQQGKDLDILAIPEMYDVIVHIFSLLLVFLSTQLYQPLVSSAELESEGRPSCNLFLQKIMEYSDWKRQKSDEEQKNKEECVRQHQAQSLGQENAGEPNTLRNEPQLFLYCCLHWLIDRPSPPRRSIAFHYVDLPKSIAQQMTNMAIAPDGMYESHSIVIASVPPRDENRGVSKSTTFSARKPMQSSNTVQNSDSQTHQTAAIALGTDDTVHMSSPGHILGDITSWNRPSNLLLHPIRSILLLSSTFFLLPIRLVRLAFNLLGHSQHRAIMSSSASYMKNLADDDRLILQQLQAHCEKQSGWNKTNNILWLSDSPIADLGSALMLVLTNNCRSRGSHPFLSELATLNDNRWDEQITKPQSTTENSLLPPIPNIDYSLPALSTNFELLFEAFGRIVHTEVGALSLYTLLLSSPIFAESLSARSDLDTICLPLLRSLYFSTTMTHDDPTITPKSGPLSHFITLTQKDRPFRSQSQLYVILILLLIFSQDPNFGRDSFRRVRVSIPTVKWYKERHIKEASLGSIILLVLLRTTTFNLNRLQDGFLLSNCCAVLLNLSPHILDLHEYVATRLVSVTTSCCKRYASLLAENGEEPEEEGDLTTLLGMHGETCRTLLTLIKHSIRKKCLEKNIHLVYALLLEQRDFRNLCQFASLGDMSSITSLIKRANMIIEENGDVMISADQTLRILKIHMAELKAYYIPERLVSDADSVVSDVSDIGNLTFTYEEEADPEVFFLPYVWDVIVGTLTTTTMEWNRKSIQVFPLNYDIEVEPLVLKKNSEGLGSSSTDLGAHDNTPDVV